MARVKINAMQWALAFLALTINFVSGSPMKRDSEHSSVGPEPGLSSEAQHESSVHLFNGVSIIELAPTEQPSTPSPDPSMRSKFTARNDNDNQEIDPDGDGGFYIARDNSTGTIFDPKDAVAGSEHSYPPFAPTTAPIPNFINKHVPQETSDPPPSISCSSIYIARDGSVRRNNCPPHAPVPVRDNVIPRQTAAPGGGGGQTTGCIIFIARDGKVKTMTPPGGCPSPPAQRVRDLPHPPQETKSSVLRVEDHFPANQHIERGVEHKPTFTTLVAPGLTTLTVAASTRRETGGVVVITGSASEKSHKTHSSKTKSWISPGTFTVTGGSGTFTVVTTHPSHPDYTHHAGRIPPPEWLLTHTKTHVRPTGEPAPTQSPAIAGRISSLEWLSPYVKTHVRPSDKPVPTDSARLAERVPPPEWLSTHTRTQPGTETHVRPTDKLVEWGRLRSAKSSTYIHTMDTLTWKHKTETVLDPTHVRPTDKPATWGQTTTESAHLRPTDQPVTWGLEHRATRPTTHIHTMDKHTYSWKHKTPAVMDDRTHVRSTDKPATWGLETPTDDLTHIRPTDKLATWGLEDRANAPTGTPTSFKPSPSPSCTLTVKQPSPIMKDNVKTVYTSTTTVTHCHLCGGCMLVTGQPQTLDRRWQATKTVRGVETVTVDKCTGGRRRPSHDPIRLRDEHNDGPSPVSISSALPANPFQTHGPPLNVTPRPMTMISADPFRTHGLPPNFTPRPGTLVTAARSSLPANPMHTHGPPPLVTPRPTS